MFYMPADREIRHISKKLCIGNKLYVNTVCRMQDLVYFVSLSMFSRTSGV